VSAIFWFDMETTGLDPDEDEVLEVAWMFSDLSLERTWGAEEFLLSTDQEWRGDQFVMDMHGRSGLLADHAVAAHDGELQEISIVDAYAAEQVLAVGGPVYLGGSGVHFDRNFMRTGRLAHLGSPRFPKLDAALHYRLVDVSVVERFVRDVCGIEVPEHTPEHRAFDDVLAAYARARTLKELIQR
jgi:oligoribonuclease